MGNRAFWKRISFLLHQRMVDSAAVALFFYIQNFSKMQSQKRAKKASKIIDPVTVTMGDNAAYFYGKINLHATDIKHQLVLHMLCTAEMYKEQQTDGDNEMPALNADADFKTIATLYHFVHAVEQGL